MTIETAIIVAVISGMLSSSVLVALIEWRRLRRLPSADAAEKISRAWDVLSEEQRISYAERIDGLLRRVQDQDRRLTEMELAMREKDRLYAELGQRLQSEIRMRVQHEKTIDALRGEVKSLEYENVTLRQRVDDLERRLGSTS